MLSLLDVFGPSNNNTNKNNKDTILIVRDLNVQVGKEDHKKVHTK